jgi:hypothetical protein
MLILFMFYIFVLFSNHAANVQRKWNASDGLPEKTFQQQKSTVEQSGVSAPIAVALSRIAAVSRRC